MEEEILKMTEQGGSSPGITPTNSNSSVDDEAEYVTLPSQGVFYKGKYKDLDKLKVRKLNWTDEDLLVTKSYYDNGTLFDEMLKQTIVDENGFQTEDLVPIDRDTIIWWLRIGAFGTEYQIPHVCSDKECKHKYNLTWDLAEFEMPDLPEEYAGEIRANGNVEILLPISQLKCKITVATIGKENKVNKFLKKRKENLAKNPKKASSADYIMTGRLLASIEVAYDNEGKEYKGIDELLVWLNKGNNGKPLPIVDSRYIIKKIKDISLIADTRKTFECPVCAHIEEDMRMPMSIYFFWPEFKEL